MSANRNSDKSNTGARGPVQQTFVGGHPVDKEDIPTNKIPDDVIASDEARRLEVPKDSREGGSATRTGAATLDPNAFDTKGHSRYQKEDS